MQMVNRHIDDNMESGEADFQYTISPMSIQTSWRSCMTEGGSLQGANFGLQAEDMWAGQIFLPRMLSQASFNISKEQVDEL